MSIPDNPTAGFNVIPPSPEDKLDHIIKLLEELITEIKKGFDDMARLS